MTEKYLPIQFFEKRKDFDDRATEGGGDSKLPSWVLAGTNLSQRSTKLVSEINDITSVLRGHQQTGKKLPLVICTTIEEKAIAKSHRGSISSLFADKERSNVLGFHSNCGLLTMVTDEKILFGIEQILSDTQNQAKLISSITDIAPFYPLIDEYDDSIHFYKIRLVNYNNFDLNFATNILFEQQCADNGIVISHKTKYTSDMTIYRVCLDSAEQLALLGDFEGVYTIEKMFPVEATLDALPHEPAIIPKKPETAEMYPIVGVLDTGIADNQFLQNWKETITFTNYPDEYRNPAHGTFVSGILEYGDELNGSSYTALPGVKLFDATVYPDETKERIFQDDLIEHIREAVERHNGIKIWNLSLGTIDETSINEFSDFGMALDNIQDENNVLIIKSSGNCTNFMRQLPKSRIAKSADSIRAIVVGSLAQTQGTYDYAEADMPSPFTRIGPGPGSIVKPDLVFYGGNAGMNHGRLCTTGVPSFTPEGKIAYNVGTSFSTPWVSRLAAELSYLMNEEFDPLLIRALMIHNAKYPAHCRMIMSDKVAQMGFGMPQNVKEMLYNSADEITLILRDTLDKGSFIEMFDFPYPTNLVDENGYFVGQIIVTLVTKSLVDDKQAGEYCQSDIGILFGTYATEKDRDTNKRTVKNPKGLEEPQNLLLDSCYSSRTKGAYPKTGFERECTLVKYGKKFHPVKKYAVDLSDITPSNKKKYLGKNRKWYLQINGLFRDFIEQDASARNYQLSQEYCLLLTIRDPQGKAPVYNEVSQQLDYKNFVHHNIKLRNIINVNDEA
ncbi:MAG: S8 family peptidase [Roseburia sp.]|nr:S8 family peptidase [Roseburia sp.]